MYIKTLFIRIRGKDAAPDPDRPAAASVVLALVAKILQLFSGVRDLTFHSRCFGPLLLAGPWSCDKETFGDLLHFTKHCQPSIVRRYILSYGHCRRVFSLEVLSCFSLDTRLGNANLDFDNNTWSPFIDNHFPPRIYLSTVFGTVWKQYTRVSWLHTSVGCTCDTRKRRSVIPVSLDTASTLYFLRRGVDIYEELTISYSFTHLAVSSTWVCSTWSQIDSKWSNSRAFLFKVSPLNEYSMDRIDFGQLTNLTILELRCDLLGKDRNSGFIPLVRCRFFDPEDSAITPSKIRTLIIHNEWTECTRQSEETNFCPELGWNALDQVLSSDRFPYLSDLHLMLCFVYNRDATVTAESAPLVARKLRQIIDENHKRLLPSIFQSRSVRVHMRLTIKEKLLGTWT